MLRPDFTSNDDVLPLVQPPPPRPRTPPPLSPLSFSLAKTLRHHVQKPKVPRPSSVSFPRPQVAHSIDARHPLSPQHPWPLSRAPLRPSTTHPPIRHLSRTNPQLFRDPSLLNPTSNAPFPLHRPSALPSSSPRSARPTPLSPITLTPLPPHPTLASLSPSR